MKLVFQYNVVPHATVMRLHAPAILCLVLLEHISVNDGPNVSAGSITCSQDEFNSAVTSNGYSTPSSDQYQSFSNNVEDGGFSTIHELAMFLAECLWESAGLTTKTENNPSPGAYANPSLVQPFSTHSVLSQKVKNKSLHVTVTARSSC